MIGLKTFRLNLDALPSMLFKKITDYAFCQNKTKQKNCGDFFTKPIHKTFFNMIEKVWIEKVTAIKFNKSKYNKTFFIPLRS